MKSHWCVNYFESVSIGVRSYSLITGLDSIRWIVGIGNSDVQVSSLISSVTSGKTGGSSPWITTLSVDDSASVTSIGFGWGSSSTLIDEEEKNKDQENLRSSHYLLNGWDRVTMLWFWKMSNTAAAAATRRRWTWCRTGIIIIFQIVYRWLNTLWETIQWGSDSNLSITYICDGCDRRKKHPIFLFTIKFMLIWCVHCVSFDWKNSEKYHITPFLCQSAVPRASRKYFMESSDYRGPTNHPDWTFFFQTLRFHHQSAKSYYVDERSTRRMTWHCAVAILIFQMNFNQWPVIERLAIPNLSYRFSPAFLSWLLKDISRRWIIVHVDFFDCFFLSRLIALGTVKCMDRVTCLHTIKYFTV